MKFNIAYPDNGTQKTIEVDDDKKCSIFFDKKIGQEVQVDTQLGEEWKNYIFKIMGGNDKQGFAMKQGVLLKGRTKLLLRKNMSCYRQRRNGEMKRKTIRGCIVGSDIRALFLTIVKKGDQEIEGVTDTAVPRRIGPKRANKIKKLFDMDKKEKHVLLRKAVIRRTWTDKNGKTRQKAPKIQRLITDDRIKNKARLQKKKLNSAIQSSLMKKEYKIMVEKYNKQNQKK